MAITGFIGAGKIKETIRLSKAMEKKLCHRNQNYFSSYCTWA